MTTSLKPLWERIRSRWMPGPEVTSEDLAAPDPTDRWRAIHLLAHHPRPELVTSLFSCLDDPDPIIRDEAVRTLASWGADYTLEQALDLLGQAPGPETTTALFDLLSELADTSTRSQIILYLDDENRELQSAAIRALGAIGSAYEVPRLEILARSPDVRVRRSACTALGDTADPAALPALRQCLNDPDPLTRQLAHQGITKIEGATAPEPEGLKASVSSILRK